jgi:hypothetical protein
MGVLEVNADTTVNPRRQSRFPNVPDKEQADSVRVVNSLLPPKRSMVVSLDRLLAYKEALQIGQRPAIRQPSGRRTTTLNERN